MCQKCNISTDDTTVTKISERTVRAWVQSITFTHAGHFFDGSLGMDTADIYTLELENKADESLLGALITDPEFLDRLAQQLTTEYKMREIFKTPHVFYIAEPERLDAESLPGTPRQNNKGQIR
jgi:hypothetical protein